MPSQENLKQKQAIIDEIGEKMSKASGIVVIDYIGISVDEANSMRTKLRDAGIDYKVYKNTLVKRAIDGTPQAGLSDVLEGPSAFAFGYEDATAPARTFDEIIRTLKKMEFKAGMIDGVVYDADGIKQIAAIPSREVLIARFLGSVQSPLGKLVRTFAAIADANGGGEATPAPAEEAAPVEEVPAEAAPAEEAAPVEEVPAEAAPEEEAAPAEEVPAEAAPEAEAAPAEAEAVPEEEATPAEAEAAPEEEAAPAEEEATPAEEEATPAEEETPNEE